MSYVYQSIFFSRDATHFKELDGICVSMCVGVCVWGGVGGIPLSAEVCAFVAQLLQMSVTISAECVNTHKQTHASVTITINYCTDKCS